MVVGRAQAGHPYHPTIHHAVLTFDPSTHTRGFIGLFLPSTGKLFATWGDRVWMKLVTLGALAFRGGGMRIALISIGVLALVFGQPSIGTAAGQAEPKVDVLIGFSQQPGPAEEALVHRAGGDIRYTYHLVPAIAAAIPESAIAGLGKNPKITGIDLDLEVHAVGKPKQQVLPWGVDRIDAEKVHTGGNNGAGVKVAVIDSGIDHAHPDLDGNYAGGHDFVNSDSDPMDDNGHGSHVAGTLAAEDNNTGVVGVAPEASLYALKVLNASNRGNWSDIIAAVQWAVDNGIQVTNNSYESSGNPGSTVQAAFDNSAAAGVLHIAAAGNSDGGNVTYPAKWNSVVAVSATTSTNALAGFSSVGPEVELAAPGKDIYSTYKDGRYYTKSGTSMASPHVAGTAALILAANPGWSNDQVRLRLRDTSDDLGSAGKDSSFGYGLVDADAAAVSSVPSTTGSISGIVRDASDGSSIGGATVSADTGQSATTASDGAYNISGVPAGERSVTASAPGFAPQTRPATVNQDQTTPVDFTLTAADGGDGGPPPCKGKNKNDPGC